MHSLVQIRTQGPRKEPRRQLRTVLTFLPPADPALPYGALPLLRSILIREGYEHVTLRDVNLEIFDDLLQRDVLARSAERAYEVLAELQAENELGNRQRIAEITSALRAAPDVLKYIDDCHRILRDKEDFYQPAKLLFAKRIFQQACGVLSAPYPGIQFGRYSYSTHEYDSFEQIEQAIQEEKNGLLATYYRDVTVPSILAHEPDVVGISIPYFSQLISTFIFAEVLREQAPDVHITMGGPVPSWGDHILSRDPRFGRWLDSVAIGEADESIIGLLEHLEGARSRQEVPNFIFYSGDNEVFRSQDSGAKVNMDWLPTPDFTALPMDRYFSPDRLICIMPTRGCYFNLCTFCNYAFIKLAPYRTRDPNLVAQDAIAIKEQTGDTIFCFESDVMLPRYLGELGRALADHEAGIQWHGVARFEKGMTDQVIQNMVEGGCVRLYMGMESANQRVLDLMVKKTTKKRMHDILNRFEGYGVAVEAGVFGRFPTETPEEAEETYEFVKMHRKSLARCDVGEFRLLRGSPISKEPEKYDIQIKGDIDSYWYHLPYEELMPRDAAADSGVMEKIQKLYPEAALIDVSEDILYTARLGPNVFHELFKPNDSEVSSQPTLPPLDARVYLSNEFIISRCFVTNSGGVLFSDSLNGVSPDRPTFACSEMPVVLAANLNKQSVFPLDEIDTVIIEAVKVNRSVDTVARHAVMSSDYSLAEVADTLKRLVNRGLIEMVVSSEVEHDEFLEKRELGTR